VFFVGYGNRRFTYRANSYGEWGCSTAADFLREALD